MTDTTLPPIPELFEGIDIRSLKLEKWYQQLSRQPVHSVQQQQILEVLEHYREPISPLSKAVYDPLPRYRDWDGEEMFFWEWGFKQEFFSTHVARDSIDDYEVSTIWLGQTIPVRCVGPRNFETILFTSTGGILDYIEPQHYGTLEEAEDGHQAMCAMLREKLKETEEERCE